MKLLPELHETIYGTVQDIRARRRTCVEVLEACLASIDELEPQVRAWVLVDRDGARARARELDAQLDAGRWLGPLHGIPIGIKDIVDVAGMPTACGWPRWSDRIASEDATIVKRLRAAGAVILGKTVTTQFASFDPPVTRNPWNLDRTPGGSSSGSAAAVACGMCLGAIGSQTGGSITRPASFCGVAGCKPRHGSVNAQGIMPLAPTMDHPGPMARTVRDVALLLDVIYGWNDKGYPDNKKLLHPRTCESLDSEASLPPRLGRLRGMFDERADAAVRRGLDEAIAMLTQAGASVNEPALLPSFADVLQQHRVIMAAEAAASHETVFTDYKHEFLPRIRELIEEGLDASAIRYLRAREHRSMFIKPLGDCFADVDTLVTPATTTPAPDTSTTGDPAFNSPWSYTGLPTVSFPIGLSPDGLPVAIQLIGRDEAPLFRVAAWCEDALVRRCP